MSLMSNIGRTLFGCAHKWETDREVLLARNTLFNGAQISGTRFYQHCEKCGDVRKKDISR